MQDHLGLASADVLGHSAGANIAVQYALSHPHRVSRLVLVTPSGRAVGLEPGAGHFPWLDDPELFVSAVTEFLN